MICKICGKELGSLGNHLRSKHNITVKEYYDKYILEDEDEKYCYRDDCSKEAYFHGLVKGYGYYCSASCLAKSNVEKRLQNRETSYCKYCEREFDNADARNAHENWCVNREEMKQAVKRGIEEFREDNEKYNAFIRKISEAHKGRTSPFKGLTKENSERAQKISKTIKQKVENGEWITEEWAQNIIASRRKNDTWQPEEAIEKMKQTLKQKYDSGELEVWNKGLTKEEHSSLESASEKLLGHEPFGGGSGKIGYREDIDITVRSTWEANFIRYLNYLGIEFLYEPKGFVLNDGRKYYPDFYIPTEDLWIEVKGVITEERLEKFNLFKNQYNKDVYLVDPEKYYEIEKEYKDKIDNWE